MCLLGSKIDHLSFCSCVTIGHLRQCHHFYFHYKFIIWTPWVRGSLKRLSHLSHGACCQTPVCWTSLSDIFLLSLSSTGWHCWSLAKDNMIETSAWATAEGNISPLKSLWITVNAVSCTSCCPVTLKKRSRPSQTNLIWANERKLQTTKNLSLLLEKFVCNTPKRRCRLDHSCGPFVCCAFLFSFLQPVFSNKLVLHCQISSIYMEILSYENLTRLVKGFPLMDG